MEGKKKNLELERLVFFSDAVVAIAITLLVFNLKFTHTPGAVLRFSDFVDNRNQFFAFFLSFLLIAVFWRVHHEFFMYITQVDNRMFRFNMGWLLFIITLPFSTTLVSDYFNQPLSILVYSLNTLFITIFQNLIWDHVAIRPDYLNDRATEKLVNDYRFRCNVAMFNAVLATGFSFISPVTALIILFLRPVMIRMLHPIFRRKNKH